MSTLTSSEIESRGIAAAATGMTNPWCRHCDQPLRVGPNGWKSTTYACWSAPTLYGPHEAVEASTTDQPHPAMVNAAGRGHHGTYDRAAEHADAADTH